MTTSDVSLTDSRGVDTGDNLEEITDCFITFLYFDMYSRLKYTG